MAKNQSEITTLNQLAMSMWRAVTIWGVGLYFILISLDIWLNHFVAYLIPLQIVGWGLVLNIVLYVWYTHYRSPIK